MFAPLVSIIVPAYNSVSTIARCVESIVAQTFSEWELIIADNNSTDDCVILCRKFASNDSRIKVIEVPKRGVSAARNAALDIARGKYVCFVDSDDIVEENYLRDLMNYQEFDIVLCGYLVDTYDRFGARIKSEIHEPDNLIWRDSEEKDKLVPLFENGYMHFCWNKLFHLSVVNNYNIRFRAATVNEDFTFVLEYLKYVHSIHVVDKPLYHWIRVEGNISGVKSIPNNIHDIYNSTQLLLRKFFANDKVADRIAYFSYDLILYKYYEARLNGRMSKRKMYEKLKDFGQNDLIRAAYKSYSPKSTGEKIMYLLARHKMFRLHYFVTQKILK